MLPLPLMNADEPSGLRRPIRMPAASSPRPVAASTAASSASRDPRGGGVGGSNCGVGGKTEAPFTPGTRSGVAGMSFVTLKGWCTALDASPREQDRPGVPRHHACPSRE